MKLVLSALLICLLASAITNAQTFTPGVRRTVKFNFVGKDSVNLSLNEEFDMIEDSCTTIVRYGHLNRVRRIFTGKFKDVLKADPSQVVTEGSYNDNGLKDGAFTAYFLNGKLQAKGNFKNGKYDGDWEVYYDDGKPRLKFNATDGVITLTDAWDVKGKKEVDNGKGNYRSDQERFYWKGKLLNGKPDGTWRAIKTDDASETDIETENYKNGVFKQGKGPLGEYTDAPRLVVLSASLLPFTRAEGLHISQVPCNGVKRKHIVGVQPRNGWQSFSDDIARMVSPFISRYDIHEFENEININGYVNEYGTLSEMSVTIGSFRDDIARGLIQQLIRVAPLVPATVDGKPAKEKMTIKFVFSKGVYHYSYRFYEVQIK